MANSLPYALHKYAPNADAQAIISAGATGFRSLIDKSDLGGVVLAFNSAVTNTYVSHFILLPIVFWHQMTNWTTSVLPQVDRVLLSLRASVWVGKRLKHRQGKSKK